jgi:predicted DsbA family dithiol-disulfide isomerase
MSNSHAAALVAALGLLGNVACRATEGGATRPVARIGTQVVTEADLEASVQARLAFVEGEHAVKVHGVKSEALAELVDARLITAQARAEGVTPEQLLDREVTAKVVEPTDLDVRAAYDQAKASGRHVDEMTGQMPSFELVRHEIGSYLRRQRGSQARRAFVNRLRAEAGVETLLPPPVIPRVKIAAEGQSKGDARAPITIVEFSDFECSFCAGAETTVKRVLAEYEGKVRVVYRDFPLPFHAKAPKASEAALCAGDQGQYWPMHERLFASQRALEIPQLKQYARELGLAGETFDRCLDGGAKAAIVEASRRAGEEAGVTGTPAFFINGKPIAGAVPFETLKAIIDGELAGV